MYIFSNASNNQADENVPVWFCWYSNLSLFIKLFYPTLSRAQHGFGLSELLLLMLSESSA